MSIKYDEKEIGIFKQVEILPPLPPQVGALDSAFQNNSGIVNLLNGQMQSPNFVTGVAGWKIDSDGSVEFGSGKFRGDITGATGTFSGTVNVGSLNIPDSTTANSMHVDSSGNTWWGANVASGISAATASVTSAGVATFKNVLIGGATIQYQVVNAGIFSFGDGSDGAGVADGSGALAGATLAANVYTMTRDVYYTDLTVSTGVTIKPSGYRIFGSGTLTLNGTAIISRNGNNGTSPGTTGSAPGTIAGGAALSDGYLKGAAGGGTGGGGQNVGNPPVAGGNGTNITNSIGSIGHGGGAGGSSSGGGAGGAAGTAGTFSASNVSLIANWHLATLLDISASGSTVKFDNSSGSGGGGGGGNGSAAGINGGDGGGGGSAGGIIAIYFRAIVIGASASIKANGGNGGNGANGDNGGVAGAGGGGGGGGGNGGQIILVYNTITNSGSLTATAGTKGTKGLKGTPVFSQTDGNDGVDGVAGTIRQFQISL